MSIDFKEIPAVRFLILFSSFFVALLIASGVAYAVSNIDSISERTGYLISSAVQCIVAFCLPAWFTAKFCSNYPSKWLYLDEFPSFMSLSGVIMLYLLALPAMNWLIEWNENIHLPEILKGLEATLRNWEETNGNVAQTILSVKSPLAVLAAVGVVGVLTGFSEELFFRGALQGILIRCAIPTALAVWGTAVIFSALHFQFFGFIPRLLMGALFGYLLVWSKSLWLPIFAHALNNSIVVIVASFPESAAHNVSIDNIGVAQNGMFPWLAMSSAAATIIFLYFFRKFLCGIKEDNDIDRK
ncbi:MAG: CPBP family intramembrane metalloprotease [Muribaculaceae bacterium]|nr:CPBP family intramembrane metalloprotease [Muribaculaceae bacterium]